ncbi:CHAP domain-containing protein [Actinoallomurus liliacearum]|uniref:CHAP domain-containing protein n=1 Tax=Actinoallomurus liliacearum TaxID=1080073 RepID=UPI0031E8B385
MSLRHPALRRLALGIAATIATTLTTGIIAATTPAHAGPCPAADPYSGACTTPVPYKVKGTDGTLAVQTIPQVDHVKKRVREGAGIGVICQINDGGTDPYDHLYSHTWDFTTAGGWVYDHYVTTPPQDPNGWSRGVRHCGAGPTSSGEQNGTPSSTGHRSRTTPRTQPTATLSGAYPWPAQDAWVADGHGYYEGECTSFAAWAVRSDGLHHAESPDWLGDAGQWDAPVDKTPRAGDVAQWKGGRNGAGTAGHVAYVEAVYDNGTIKIEEYNWGRFHRWNTRIIPTSDPSRFLHF